MRTPAAALTEPAPNTFPKLPVRTGEDVFVHIARFASAAHHQEHLDGLDTSVHWREDVLPELTGRLLRDPQTLRLIPTERSRLR